MSITSLIEHVIRYDGDVAVRDVESAHEGIIQFLQRVEDGRHFLAVATYIWLVSVRFKEAATGRLYM